MRRDERKDVIGEGLEHRQSYRLNSDDVTSCTIGDTLEDIHSGYIQKILLAARQFQSWRYV